MAVATLRSRRWLRPALWSAGLGILWLVLALLRPETTFHLAPLLIAAAPPVLSAIDTPSPAVNRVIALGIIGLISALIATALVAVTGSMEGPPFEGFTGPLPEALILTGAGSLLGTGFGWLRSR